MMHEEAAVLRAETAGRTRGTSIDYLRPLRFDHWIKNVVVLVGSTLALAADRSAPTVELAGAALLAFLISGFVSSVNYAINEVLDAPYDARHPVKCQRPIPSGRVQVRPLLGLTAAIAMASIGAAAWLFPPRFVLANLVLFVAALVYNLPPIRLKDWPYLDVVAESVTNPIRMAIGWYAVSPDGPVLPPAPLLVAVWAFGCFLMTGKRLAELRLLGDRARFYRDTFRAYSVRGLFLAKLGYAIATLLGCAWLFAAERPQLLWTLPLVVVVLGWTFRMTFEPESPVSDPERLYRRPVFLLLMLAAFAAMLAVSLR